MKKSFFYIFLLFGIPAFGQTDSFLNVDSNKIQKIELINRPLEKLAAKLSESNDKSNPIWNILTPLLIGAALTILTQLMLDLWKTSKETRLKKTELISRAKAKQYLIAQITRHIATFKVLKQYYIRAYFIADNDKEKANSDAKQHETGRDQRLTESQLDKAISEYLEIVTEYIFVTKSKVNFNPLFDRIINYEHPKAPDFSHCNTEKQLATTFDDIENKVRQQYADFLNLIQDIQNLLT